MYVCTIPTAHMLVRVATVETAEGGEVSHALNEWNTYCKVFNSLCSEVTVCLSKHSERENSLNGVEELFLQIPHTTLGCCCSRPPGQSNTWAQVKCLIFTFLVNSKCTFSYSTCKSTYVPGLSVSSIDHGWTTRSMSVIHSHLMTCTYAITSSSHIIPLHVCVQACLESCQEQGSNPVSGHSVNCIKLITLVAEMVQVGWVENSGHLECKHAKLHKSCFQPVMQVDKWFHVLKLQKANFWKATT